MEVDLQRFLIWGFLRVVLGYAQMLFAIATFVSLLARGFVSSTWMLFGAASLATLLSRLLYGGKPQPPKADRMQRDR